VFLLSALLKTFAPLTLCGPDPWDPLNAAALPLEVLLAVVLLGSRDRARRSLAALTGLAFTMGALVVLTAVEFLGPRYQWEAAGRSCGCFGPVELPYAAHLALLLVMAGCLAATWVHEESHRTPLKEGADAAGGAST
jgi:hypothetical protein